VQSVDSPADGLRGKPHPDIFLEAARRAGMAAVALTTTLGASALSGYPNVCAVHADLATLDPLALIATLAAPTREQHHA
jgi:beta-phosphoglucomutase-like phosphatase (HAD superfamily)